MKILKKVGLSLFIFSLFFYSCNRQDDIYKHEEIIPTTLKSNSSNYSSRISNLDKEELVRQLSKDSDFINLGNSLVDFFEKIPHKSNFIKSYSDEDFRNKGESYFLNLTGYSDIQVREALNNINSSLYNLYQKYPQLKYDGSNLDFINQVIDEASIIVETNYSLMSRRNLAACHACVKKWKPRMIMSTIAGGIIGGATGSLFGAWGGAVLGFASAGWGAQDCLEAAGC